MANAIAGKVEDRYIVVPLQCLQRHIEFPETVRADDHVPFCKMETMLSFQHSRCRPLR